MAHWRLGRSPAHAPDAWVMGRDLSPLVLEAVAEKYFSSSSMDTGRSFPLCLDSCMDSTPAEKQDFSFFLGGSFITGFIPGSIDCLAVAGSTWAGEMAPGL